jgi:hypothetical protein
MDAVAPNLGDPKSAKYRTVKYLAVVDNSSTNYCATVGAKSPDAPCDGHQAVAVQMVGGRVNSATMDRRQGRGAVFLGRWREAATRPRLLSGAKFGLSTPLVNGPACRKPRR